MNGLFAHLQFIWFGKENHVRNYESAKKIITRLKSFVGENLAARQLSYLRKIDPYCFEEIILNAFRAAGYKIIRNESYSGDGGIDGQCISPDGQKYLIQAKRYSDHIRLSDVTAFETLVLNSGMKGYFIHTGRTGQAVRRMLFDSPVTVISGERLLQLILNSAVGPINNKKG